MYQRKGYYFKMEELVTQLTSHGWTYDILKMNRENQRFDHLGHVGQVRNNGRVFLSEEKEPAVFCNKGKGICSEFTASRPVGFTDAEIGEFFLKIGCGLLRKTDENYSFRNVYEFIPIQTKISSGRDYACAEAEQEEVRGYAYKYKKTYHVEGNCLTISHCLRNTGNRNLQWESYAHNFFSVDFENDENVLLDRRGEEYRAVFSSPYREIRENTDFHSEKFKVWTAKNCICPEVFFAGTAVPGEQVCWRRTYKFI